MTVEAEGGLKSEVQVEVFNGLAMIEVSPNNIAAMPGEEIQLSARGLDYLGNEVPLGTVNWSVVMNIAKVDETGKLTIPDIKGMVIVNAFASGQIGTAYLRVNAGEILIEADVPAKMQPGEKVQIPIVVTQDGKVVKLPVQVDTQVGTWDSATQTLTARAESGKGNFVVFVAGVAREYWIQVGEETDGEGTGESAE